MWITWSLAQFYEAECELVISCFVTANFSLLSPHNVTASPSYELAYNVTNKRYSQQFSISLAGPLCLLRLNFCLRLYLACCNPPSVVLTGSESEERFDTSADEKLSLYECSVGQILYLSSNIRSRGCQSFAIKNNQRTEIVINLSSGILDWVVSVVCRLSSSHGLPKILKCILCRLRDALFLCLQYYGLKDEKVYSGRFQENSKRSFLQNEFKSCI